MNIVVDTSVWSLLLRRHRIDYKNSFVLTFQHLIDHGHTIHLVGVILQELLDGVAKTTDFERLLTLLQPFPLLPFSRETFIAASRLRNACRKRGVQATAADFLIAASCIEYGYPLLTADKDFSSIAKYSELNLVEV